MILASCAYEYVCCVTTRIIVLLVSERILLSLITKVWAQRTPIRDGRSSRGAKERQSSLATKEYSRDMILC